MTVSQTPLLSHDLGSCEAASCSSRDKVGLWADTVGHGSRVLLSLSHRGTRYRGHPVDAGPGRLAAVVCAGFRPGRGCVLGSHLAAGVCWALTWPRVCAGFRPGRGWVLGSHLAAGVSWVLPVKPSSGLPSLLLGRQFP